MEKIFLFLTEIRLGGKEGNTFQGHSFKGVMLTMEADITSCKFERANRLRRVEFVDILVIISKLVIGNLKKVIKPVPF